MKTLALLCAVLAAVLVATATGAPKPATPTSTFSGARVLNPDAQTTQGQLEFTEATYDVGGYCTLPCTELIAPTDGYYRFCATVQAYLPDAAYFQLVLDTREEADNDVFGTDRSEVPNQNGPTYLHACKTMHVTAGNRFEVGVYWQSAETRYVTGGADVTKIGS